jgi:hypothetical protein
MIGRDAHGVKSAYENRDELEDDDSDTRAAAVRVAATKPAPSENTSTRPKTQDNDPIQDKSNQKYHGHGSLFSAAVLSLVDINISLRNSSGEDTFIFYYLSCHWQHLNGSRVQGDCRVVRLF